MGASACTGCALVEVVERERLRAEAQVAGLVEVDGERVQLAHEEPLPDVELRVVDQQRTLCTRA